jgi:peptidoglycan/xylan/chitin deacetylase (PgdA/CDA1 family)
LAAERIGFVMAGDGAGRQALAAHAGALSAVAVGLVSVRGPQHAWIEAQDEELADVLRAQPRLAVLLMVQNDAEGDAGWDGAGMARLLADPAQRLRFLDRIEAAMARWNARGVVLDLENLPAAAHGDYQAFLAQARARLAPRGQQVLIAAPVADAQWDLAAYARAVDRVILMAYDQHWLTGRAGPIAAQGWFARVVAEGVAAVGADKAVVALGSYAYDWPDGGQAEPISLDQAWQRARGGHCPAVRCGQRQQRLCLSPRRAPAPGVAAGCHGQLEPDAGAAPPGPGRPGAVEAGRGRSGVLVRAGRSGAGHGRPAGAAGRGPAGRRRSAAPGAPAQGGWRQAAPAGDGLIHQAAYRRLPAAHEVWRGGMVRREVALTFDDGPDPRWTPQILAVLRRHGVPATFFVTGSNALGEPGLLRAILAQGSELGNHSTTHPDLDRLGDAAVALEINATQRLVESYTGRSLRLFRAPYLGDADPDTAARLRVPRIAAGLGYLTVGLNVDPLDWTGADAATLVARTVAQVESGNAHAARQVVLLHDSGGDRHATVQALPQIIAQLRARGYRFVTVSELVGLSRDQAMPRSPGRKRRWPARRVRALPPSGPPGACSAGSLPGPSRWAWRGPCSWPASRCGRRGARPGGPRRCPTAFRALSRC